MSCLRKMLWRIKYTTALEQKLSFCSVFFFHYSDERCSDRCCFVLVLFLLFLVFQKTNLFFYLNAMDTMFSSAHQVIHCHGNNNRSRETWSVAWERIISPSFTITAANIVVCLLFIWAAVALPLLGELHISHVFFFLLSAFSQHSSN